MHTQLRINQVKIKKIHHYTQFLFIIIFFEFFQPIPYFFFIQVKIELIL